MKPHLLFRDRDFSPRWGMLLQSPYPNWWRDREFDSLWKMLPPDKRMVTQDLGLDLLFTTMAREDRLIFEVAKNVVLMDGADPGTVRYRQDILRDCMKNPEIVRDLYRISTESIDKYKKDISWYSHQSADSIRSTSIQAVELLVESLRKLRDLADEHAGAFESEGFSQLFVSLDSALPDEYIASIRKTLGELKLPHGACISAGLGKGNNGTGYALQRYREMIKEGWFRRIFSKEPPSHYTFVIADRDTTGYYALGELRDRGVNSLAGTLSRSSDHLLQYLIALRNELAFYLGCLNLSEQLAGTGRPVCFPEPCEPGTHAFMCTSLYDLCMALTPGQGVTGNDVDADGMDLIVITGANRGGKSTFLRSVGLAQLMMQAGSFVPAESFRSDVSTGLFTHFKREEDHSMRSGKLDEELKRMSGIVDCLKPGSMVLFNESFAATNEREGSEISRQIVCALLAKRIRVLFVNHLYEFSHGLYETGMGNALFLRAERKPDGERTFRMIEGEPLQTSYGEDLYRRIFSETGMD